MRVVLLTQQENEALKEIKRFFVTHCFLPNHKVLADLLNINSRTAGLLISQLNSLGVLERNRCNGWRFSRIPYEIEVRG